MLSPSLRSRVNCAKHLLFLRLQKQILRILESDGLHRSPEIGLRRFAPQNDIMIAGL
jgi:hypothetical protein